MTQVDTEAHGLRLVGEHIRRVQYEMSGVIGILALRMAFHDQSKYSPEESALVTGKAHLDSLQYGSPEYYRALSSVKAALRHHYEHNPHHPEHYANGVAGMTLFDLFEMLCDWEAAGQSSGGSIEQSMVVNADRFKLSPELVSILMNTAHELGWVKGKQ